MRDQILGASPEQRSALLEDYLRREVARLVGLDAGELDRDESIANFGLDSMGAIELRERIETALRITVRLERFMEEPSVANLTTALLAEMVGNANPDPDPWTARPREEVRRAPRSEPSR